jgi:hypothetical protein
VIATTAENTIDPFKPLDFDGISNKRPEAGVDETADDPEVSFF